MFQTNTKRGVIIGIIIGLVILVWIIPIGIQLWQIDQDLARVETEFASIETTLNQQLERLDQIADDLSTKPPGP